MEDRAGIGTNRLIKNGAILVTNPNDILKFFKNKGEVFIEKKTIERIIPKEYKQIYNQLKMETLNADEISKKTKINIIEVNSLLTLMELEGYIENLPGNHFKCKEF